MICHSVLVCIIIILTLALVKKTQQHRPTYINAGKSSSKTAEVDISYKNGTIPTSLLTVDASGNMNVLDVKHLESLLEASIEKRSKEWGEWAKEEARKNTETRGKAWAEWAKEEARKNTETRGKAWADWAKEEARKNTETRGEAWAKYYTTGLTNNIEQNYVRYDDEVAIGGLWGCSAASNEKFLGVDGNMHGTSNKTFENFRWYIRRRCGGCDENTCNGCIKQNPVRRGNGLTTTSCKNQ